VEVVGVGSMSMYKYFDIIIFSSSSPLLSFSQLTIIIPAQPRRETGSPAAQGFFFQFHFFFKIKNAMKSRDIKRKTDRHRIQVETQTTE
jgi:hypothetical protein